MKHEDDKHVLVNAIVSSEKVFLIPRQKVGKFMISKSDETKNFQEGPSETARVIKDIYNFMRNHNGSLSIPSTSTSTNEGQNTQSPITTSPQVKRKGKSKFKEDSSSSSSSGDEVKISKILMNRHRKTPLLVPASRSIFKYE